VEQGLEVGRPVCQMHEASQETAYEEARTRHRPRETLRCLNSSMVMLFFLERSPDSGRGLQRLAMQSSECIAGHAPEFQPRVRGDRNENDTFRIRSERTAPPDDVGPTNPCGCGVDKREESGPRR
jgi:hypothetical protein